MMEIRTLEYGKRLSLDEKRLSAESRNSAVVAGESYFTYPARCSKGHDPIRYVSDSKCVYCVREYKASVFDPKRQKARRDANIEHTRAYRSANKARRKGAEGVFSSSDIKEHFLMQGGLCAGPRCKRNLSVSGFEIDHIVPVSKGGSNWPDNLQLLCAGCNRRKSSIMPEFWN